MGVAVLKGYALEGIVGAATGIGAMVWAIRRSPGGDIPDHEHPESAPADTAPGRRDQ